MRRFGCYWPGAADEFWSSVGTTCSAELARYDAVIHLRTPALEHGYNHQNPLRTESAEMAAEVDARIAVVWSKHPRRFMVESSADFLDKAARALEILRRELPECCRRHVVPALHGLCPAKRRNCMQKWDTPVMVLRARTIAMKGTA